jgi:pimeloyl-ACP methyl ester carboxylesterase
MRGHGRSGSPDDPRQYSQDASVADMEAVLDACGIGRVVAAGLSLGGYLSLAFRLARPDRVAALVLCDTGPGFRSDQARQRWNDSALAQAARLERGGLAALGGGPETRAAGHHSAAGLAHAARGMLTQRDASVIESLPSITVPALVLVGALDKPFLAAADYMAAKIPGAARAVIPEAGHASNIDQPEEFNRQVLAFLQQPALR